MLRADRVPGGARAQRVPPPPEDEARHRVRSFKNAATLLQYPVAGAYRVSRPLHGALAPAGKIRFLTWRKGA